MYRYDLEKRFILDYVFPPLLVSIAATLLLLVIYLLIPYVFVSYSGFLHICQLGLSLLMLIRCRQSSTRNQVRFLQAALRDPQLSLYVESFFSKSYHAYNPRQYRVLTYGSACVFMVFALFLTGSDIKAIPFTGDVWVNTLLTKELFLYLCMQMVYLGLVSMGVKKTLNVEKQ